MIAVGQAAVNLPHYGSLAGRTPGEITEHGPLWREEGQWASGANGEEKTPRRPPPMPNSL